MQVHENFVDDDVVSLLQRAVEFVVYEFSELFFIFGCVVLFC
jgi:hypothetical protein